MPNPKQAEDMQRLEEDAKAVFVYGTKKASDLPEPYRQRVIDYYRFSATRYNSSQETHVNVTFDTLDII